MSGERPSASLVRWAVLTAVFVGVVALAISGLTGNGHKPATHPPAPATLTASHVDFSRVAQRQGLIYYLLPGHPGHLGPGDPHGILLKELEPVTAAVPAGSTLAYVQYFDAQTESCDGRGATEGWDGPDVEVQFAWHGPTSELLSFAARQLRARGWTTTETVSSIVGPDVGFTKHLSWGSVATGWLEPSNNVPDWSLSVQATPDGRVGTGC